MGFDQSQDFELVDEGRSETPAFDASKPFSLVDEGGVPRFDPSQPHELIDESYERQLKELGITPEEAAAAVAPAEKTADLMMERKRLGRVVDLQQPITDLESVVTGVAHPIYALGGVVNSAGNLMKAAVLDAGLTPNARASGDGHLKEGLKSYFQTPPVMAPPGNHGFDAQGKEVPGMGPAEEGVYDAAAMVPTVAAAAGLEALGIPAPVAMGTLMGSSRYAETKNPTEGLKAAATGMIVPPAGQLGRLAVAKTLSAAAERGLISGNATLAQKALESVGSQVLIQGALEGMNLAEYWDMPPEERKARIIRNLVANTAFWAMEAPNIVGGGASATEGALGPKAKTALLVEALMKDPVAGDALRQRVDEAVFDALAGGHRAEASPAEASIDFVPEGALAMPGKTGSKMGAMSAEEQRAKLLGEFYATHERAVKEAKSRKIEVKEWEDEGAQAVVSSGGVAVDLGESDGTWKVFDDDGRVTFESDDKAEALARAKEDLKDKLEASGEAAANKEYEGDPEQTMWEMSKRLDLPEGWKVRNATVANTGSHYWELEAPNGDYFKVRIADHEPSDFREREFGANDRVFYAKPLTPDTFAQAMDRLEAWLENKSQSMRPKGQKPQSVLGSGPEIPKTGKEQAATGEGEASTGNLATVEKATLPRRIESDTAAPESFQTGTAPVSLADIRQYLSKALDIPVRMGVNVKGGLRALALFRIKPETIRMKALNDIPTLAHEVGHYLHFILFPERYAPGMTPKAQSWSKRFDGELLPLGTRTSRPSYAENQVRMEGVAEFFREWLTDRTQALAKAPTFAGFFESELQSKFPEVWKIVTTAREALGRYINQPALMKVRSMISRRPQPERTTVKEWFQKQYANWVDDLAPVERSLKKLEKFGLPAAQAKMVTDYAVNYIGGWRGKVEHSLFARQIDLDGGDVGPSLREILHGVESLDEFGDYLVALRAIEKNSQGKETGIDSADAREAVRAYGLKYAGKAGELRSWQRNNLLLLKDAGVISKDQVAKMEAMNQDYVPFFRVYESVGGGSGTKKGEGFVNLGQGVGRFKGSDRQIIDPLESIVKNAYLFRDLAERNRVGQMFVDAVDATRGGGRVAEEIARKVKPTQVSHDEVVETLKRAGLDTDALGVDDLDLAFKVWRAARNQSAKDGVFTVWKEGKETPYQLDDPELMRAVALADATDARFFSQIPGLGVARSFTRVLRAGATLVPEFIVRNPFRDQVTAGVFSRFGFVPFYDGFRGVFHALRKDHWYYDWMAAGGRYSDFVAMDRTDLRKTLEDVVKEPGALKVALGLANPLNVLQNLRKFSELMEQATRISEFRRAKQAGASDVEAANASKEVTLNFARAGFKGKFWNQMIAFFNASVQDLDKTIRAHKERPLRTAFKGLAYITVPSLLSWYLAKDDKEMQRLPMWRKNFFWNVNLRDLAKVAGVPMEGDFILSFPKPFLLGQIYGSSVERGLDYINGRDPNAIRKWAAGVLQATPLSIDAVVPTIVRPAFEAWANRSFFRGQPLENDSMKELPPAQRLTPQSSLTGRLIAEQLPWEWGVSPMKFDNTVRGYLGGLGKYGTDAADWLIAKVGIMNLPAPAEKSMWELPVLRGFVRTPYEASAYVQRFYDALELAEQRVNAVKKMPLVMESSQAQRFVRAEKEDLAFYLAPVDGQPMITHLRNARKDLGQVMKAMTMVQVSPGMSPQEKAQKLKALSSLRDMKAEAFFRTMVSPQDQRRVF